MYYLRELEKSDLIIINKWRNNPEIMSSLGSPFRFINLTVDEIWFEKYMSNRANEVRCAIVKKGENLILGLVSLVAIDYMNQSAQFHILIGDSQNHRKGIGTFAVNAMLHHAFYNMNLQRIELLVLEDNLPAQHLYNKTGFVREGLKRQARFKNGKYSDLYLYAILRNEYIDKTNLGGGEEVEGLPDYCIKKENISTIKKAAMEICDSAFLYSICKRPDYNDLFTKINHYADFIVAYTHDILGYVAIYANDYTNGIAYITLIGVRKEYQNRHIGRSLLHACFAIGKYRKLKAIKLEVRKNNKSAIYFYKNNGFKIIDEASENSYYMLCSI